MTVDLDALIAEARKHAKLKVTYCEELMDRLADALESTLAELRQERERADENERRWHAAVKRANQIVSSKLGLAEDLYRAEGTIAAVDDFVTRYYLDTFMGEKVLAILTEYDKQKEN